MLVIKLAELAYFGQLPETVLMCVVGQLLRQGVIIGVSPGLDAPLRPASSPNIRAVVHLNWCNVSSR